MPKPKKNRSAREKKLARERARRHAVRSSDACRLYQLQPPFEFYKEWIRVPDQAKNTIQHPAAHDDRLSDDAKELLDCVIKLGPRYGGRVPMAAIYLDKQLTEGHMHMAVTGQPGMATTVPIQELAKTISNPDTVAEMAAKYPEAELEAPKSATTDDGTSWHVHNLHAHGALVMDDDMVMHMALPPQRPGDEWKLSGNWTDD